MIKVAARLAYYAVFHMAEALIFERASKVVKTHSGFRTEFARLARNDVAIDPKLGRCLAQFYIFKDVADYAIGDPIAITVDDALDAIRTASTLLETTQTALS